MNFALILEDYSPIYKSSSIFLIELEGFIQIVNSLL